MIFGAWIFGILLGQIGKIFAFFQARLDVFYFFQRGLPVPIGGIGRDPDQDVLGAGALPEAPIDGLPPIR